MQANHSWKLLVNRMDASCRELCTKRRQMEAVFLQDSLKTSGSEGINFLLHYVRGDEIIMR